MVNANLTDPVILVEIQDKTFSSAPVSTFSEDFIPAEKFDLALGFTDIIPPKKIEIVKSENRSQSYEQVLPEAFLAKVGKIVGNDTSGNTLKSLADEIGKFLIKANPTLTVAEDEDGVDVIVTEEFVGEEAKEFKGPDEFMLPARVRQITRVF